MTNRQTEIDREIDARVLILVALAATAAVVSTPADRGLDFALWAASLAAVSLLCRISTTAILHRLLHALPIIILIVATVPFSVPGEPLWSPVTGLTATREGTALAISIVCRAALAIAVLAILSEAVSAPRLLTGLRGLGCPAPIVMILGMLWRNLGLLGGQWRQMRRAAMSRSPARRRPLRSARVLGQMAAMVFVRTLDRSERVQRAMAARGFDGTAAAAASDPMILRDWAVLTLGVTAVVTLRLMAEFLA